MQLKFLEYPVDRPYALQNAKSEHYQHPTSLVYSSIYVGCKLRIIMLLPSLYNQYFRIYSGARRFEA